MRVASRASVCTLVVSLLPLPALADGPVAPAPSFPAPVYPYDTGVAIQPAPVPIVVQPAPGIPGIVIQQAQAAPPVAAPQPGYPIYPYGTYGTYGTYGATTGTAPGYYYPPPGYAPPVYSYPPPQPNMRLYRPAVRVRERRPVVAVEQPAAERPRFFALGLHAGVLGLNQEIGGKALTLGGAGLEMRFRTRGRFGLELAVDFLHGNAALNGAITRDSVPVTLSALVYIFPNSDAHVFNLYFLGGVGVVSDTMTLVDENAQQVKQGFTEYEAHLGLGLELRFHWFALRADVRGLSLWRDDRDTPAAYYQDVEGAPIAKHSYGVQGTAGASIWF